MKKLFLLLILSFFSAQSYAGSCPDGSEPVKSISADGTYFVFNCGGSNTSNSSASSKKVAKALAGIDIENDPNIDFFMPLTKPFPTEYMYSWGFMWRIADFNNDDIADIIYIGTMNLNSNSIQCTYQVCSDQQIDNADKPQPVLYLGDADGNLYYSPELLIDNRDNKGMALGRQLLIADYNNDKVLDIYIADHGVGKADGYRDSYYLSQPNGTWIESSDTHLSDNNFKVYDHGGATGDIDNDGDMDIVITAMSSGFWCLMNDGSGFLTKRQCGGSFAFALEIADMDNDGDLDAIVGGHENNTNGMLTGIHWNDGQGNFMPYNTTPLLKYRDRWGIIPEVSASDLDNDSDMDIVYSRTGKSYKGAAIQIIENLGNKKFKDHGIIPLVSFDGWIDGIRFRDLDKDGDNDVYLSSERIETSGAVVLNNGNFDFSLIMPPNSFELYEKLDANNFIGTSKKLTEEKQAREEKLAAMKAELAADAARIKAEKAAEIEAEKAKNAEARAKQLAEDKRLAEENKNSPLFDGRYSFNLLRYHDDEDWQELGNGYIEINNGIMTIAKEGRILNTDSTDLYDSFAGQINKKGNITSSLKINVLFGKTNSFLVALNGSIDSPLQGKWDHYYDVILKLGKKE